MMPLRSKLLLIILDGLPWRNWKPFMGNLEGWAQSGEARKWRMRSVLPSTSACCYASIHTGVPPQVHGISSNEFRKRVEQPDIFSEVTRGGRQDGRRDPFLLVGVLQPLPVRSGARHRI
jgi:predicted AlkP superfamily pyrophosphatase or phosphodiesterase